MLHPVAIAVERRAAVEPVDCQIKLEGRDHFSIDVNAIRLDTSNLVAISSAAIANGKIGT